MGKGFLTSLKSYAKNVALHVGRVASLEESPLEAMRGVHRDAQKLTRRLHEDPNRAHRQMARDCVDEGRRAYNEHNYEVAEEKFRSALTFDKDCAIAYTYLGHTLYKMGKASDATTYWRMAVQTAPDSDAAAKALKKLQMMGKKREQVREWMDEHDIT